jgi:transposase
MTLPTARSVKGEKAYSPRPTSQGEHHTTVGIMGKEGMIFHETFKGFLTKEIFIMLLKTFIIDIFANTDKWLILDNAPVHKSKEVRKLLEENNVNYLYLPPYSPEYNPIELGWSKMKQLIKKWKPRTPFSLHFFIHNAIKSISQTDINGYFSHVNKEYAALN